MPNPLITSSIFIVLVSILLAGCHSAPKNYVVFKTSSSSVVEKKKDLQPPQPTSEMLSSQGNQRHYKVGGKTYEVQAVAVGERMRGKASWYGKHFNKRRTANGEIFDMQGLSAAHKTLPLPSYVKVTNLSNGKQVVVRVNDRGPFYEERIIDLSYRAAKAIDMAKSGVASVEVEVVQVPRAQHRIKNQEVFIQVAAYRGPKYANRLVRHLKNKGIDAFIAKPKSSRSKIHRVKVGPLLKPELKKVQAVLRRVGHRDYILVR